MSLIGPVPEHWLLSNLGEACRAGGGDIQTGPFGSQLHASDYVERGTPSVMPQNIGDNCITTEGIARISDEDAQRLHRHALRSGDIVYSRRGDVERRSLVRPKEEGWLCGTGCLRVRTGDASVFDARFLSYYLGHPEVRAWIVRHAVGATMPNLNTGILAALPVVIPPLPEQHEVADALDSLDNKIQHNEAFASALEAHVALLFEQEVASAASSGTLTSACLSDLALINASQVRPKAVGTLRYVDIASVKRGRLEFPPATPWDQAPGRARRGVRSGDTLWSTVRPGRRSHLLLLDAPEDMVASTGFAVLSPRQVGPAYLYASTTRDAFVDYLEAVAEGSAYPAVKPARFEQAAVPLLPPESRDRFETVGIACYRRASAARAETQALANLRDLLLPALVQGRPLGSLLRETS